MTTPYREPIKLAPLLGEPKPLMPFHPWWGFASKALFPALSILKSTA